MPARLHRPSFGHSLRLAGLVVAAALTCSLSFAQPGAVTAPDNSLPWASLTVAQQTALAPLKSQWTSTDATRKAKWLVVAERYPTMSVDEKQRLQARMTEWARMSPQQRGQVRLQYRDARALNPAQRKESWAQYQALPPEQKQALQNKAVQDRPARTANAAGNTATVRQQGAARQSAESPIQRQGRPLLTPQVARESAAPRVVSPVDVQAGAGATTTLLNRSPALAPRQAGGLSQRQGILALPPHVDRRTLLPMPQVPAQRLTQSQKPATSSGTAKQ